ncbi:hypothetical protein WMF31_38715 [Sorangium sp. So ce1036]|uniref:hypothetical protein n=1 Tax=Sorangium sp. So ce1036 TaxID=3133328 RepID=UPI003F0E7843
MINAFKGLGSLAAAGLVFAVGLVGCSSHADDHEAELGSLSLPLSANGSSGARYQLRNATFEIQGNYYYWDYGAGGFATSGATTGGGGYYVSTVNTEDYDPGASSITVDLEQGGYYVTLLPGWSFEKIEGDTVTNVEATLLSSQQIYVYVSPRSTTWAQYQFGIGDRALWLNGKLNIGIDVHEDPDDYYGAGGAGGGSWGEGGAGGGG